MPGLKGQAKHGRVIYLIDTETSVVYLMWIYTHAKFAGRPPEKSLRQLVDEAIDEQADREQSEQ
jgi:hypothetical protein